MGEGGKERGGLAKCGRECQRGRRDMALMSDLLMSVCACGMVS